MPGRTYSPQDYRFGFNGKEKDDEGMGGGGATYDYGFRIYNPQIAKFLSVDPLTKSYPWFTPYQFAANMPIWAVDVDGLEGAIATITKFTNMQGVVQYAYDFQTSDEYVVDEKYGDQGILTIYNDLDVAENSTSSFNSFEAVIKPNAMQHIERKSRQYQAKARAGFFRAVEIATTPVRKIDDYMQNSVKTVSGGFKGSVSLNGVFKTGFKVGGYSISENLGGGMFEFSNTTSTKASETFEVGDAVELVSESPLSYSLQLYLNVSTKKATATDNSFSNSTSEVDDFTISLGGVSVTQKKDGYEFSIGKSKKTIGVSQETGTKIKRTYRSEEVDI